MSRPATLERRLGHRFSNAALLERALTHSSFSGDNNERLEFLGDSVLGCAVAEVLYTRFPGIPEGKLTHLRVSLVRKEALAQVGEHLELAQHLRIGAGLSASITPSVLADAVEALFGAIFVDGGYAAVQKSLLKAFEPLLAQIDPHAVAKDSKTQLQEIMHARKLKLPEYQMVSAERTSQSNLFEVNCVLADLKLSAVGKGSSLQRAQQQAAKEMLEKLKR